MGKYRAGAAQIYFFRFESIKQQSLVLTVSFWELHWSCIGAGWECPTQPRLGIPHIHLCLAPSSFTWAIFFCLGLRQKFLGSERALLFPLRVTTLAGSEQVGTFLSCCFQNTVSYQKGSSKASCYPIFPSPGFQTRSAGAIKASKAVSALTGECNRHRLPRQH